MLSSLYQLRAPLYQARHTSQSFLYCVERKKCSDQLEGGVGCVCVLLSGGVGWVFLNVSHICFLVQMVPCTLDVALGGIS